MARAGAIGLWVSPTIEEIAALSMFAAIVAGRFGGGRAMVDDPDFAELAGAQHDLIELSVVRDGVAVDPVGQKTGELLSTGRSDITQALEAIQRVVFLAIRLLVVGLLVVGLLGVIFLRLG